MATWGGGGWGHSVEVLYTLDDDDADGDNAGAGDNSDDGDDNNSSSSSSNDNNDSNNTWFQSTQSAPFERKRQVLHAACCVVVQAGIVEVNMHDSSTAAQRNQLGVGGTQGGTPCAEALQRRPGKGRCPQVCMASIERQLHEAR